MRRDKNKNKMVCLSGEVHCHCQTEEMPLQKQIETYKKKITVDIFLWKQGKTEGDSDYINLN